MKLKKLLQLQVYHFLTWFTTGQYGCSSPSTKELHESAFYVDFSFTNRPFLLMSFPVWVTSRLDCFSILSHIPSSMKICPIARRFKILPNRYRTFKNCQCGKILPQFWSHWYFPQFRLLFCLTWQGDQKLWVKSHPMSIRKLPKNYKGSFH